MLISRSVDWPLLDTVQGVMQRESSGRIDFLH